MRHATPAQQAVQDSSSSESDVPEEQPSNRTKRASVESRPTVNAVDTSSEEEREPAGGGREPDYDTEGSSGESPGGEEFSGSDSDPGGNIPFGELVALRTDGSTSAAAMKARAQALKSSKASFKRDSRHRPMEMSSKRPVPVFREALQGAKREVRDPRFESLTGKYSEDKFKKQYAFLFDEKLPQEKKDLKEALKKAKNPNKRAELQAQLVHVEQQLRNEAARRRKAEFEKDVKAKEKAAVGGGKAPFYLKKSEKRRLELLAKYESLKSSGGLEKYMAKRRKKNAAKDHRYLPVGRRGQQQQQGAGGDE